MPTLEDMLCSFYGATDVETMLQSSYTLVCRGGVGHVTQLPGGRITQVHQGLFIAWGLHLVGNIPYHYRIKEIK